MKFDRKFLKILFSCLCAGTSTLVWAEQSCFFLGENGVFKTVNSLDDVPEKFREQAKCSKVTKSGAGSFDLKQDASKADSSKSSYIKKLLSKRNSKESKSLDRSGRPVRPDEVELSKSRRSVDLSTALGRVNLRWDRSVEKLFAKMPERAVQTAMKSASRVLSLNSFPTHLKQGNYNWKIVIMDKVPANVLINMQGRCHPAWMRPPADIFVSARHLASGCSDRYYSREEASIQLQETLVHEIGHAIEFLFLGKGMGRTERWHNEGFATWFESLGAKYISGGGVNRSNVRLRAKKAWHPDWHPRMFQGTGADYARAYALIATIAEKRSILRLSDIYKYMGEKRVNLLQAIEEEGGWDLNTLKEKTAKNLGLDSTK